ncbi:DUF4280 domain-containing protein [Azospirillum agricola]|uniref:DUF4280 domain-containing protein n=1 Tax=Azospirillum agricola TaxID=1720247 RepID=UPI000A0F2D29|nr:DUF4280 domain-containing protein [Azospirillum agricola]SMH63006.1 protein of unknown function [Azospirillum lipoferum]
MGLQVVMGAMTQCSFGAAPSSLMVLPTNRVMCGGVPAATIMDFAPMMNILPFAMCNSPANPMVIAATAAAMGVLTPMPCIPLTTPWTPGVPQVLIGGMPALNDGCKCMCAWGGSISVSMAGQFQTQD